MDISTALGIVSALATGINPMTGEPFDDDSLFQSPDMIRALYVAVQELEIAKRRSIRKNNQRALLPNAGKVWSDEEDRALLEHFDQGLDVMEIARKLGRTTAGVRARLERHGKLGGGGWRAGSPDGGASAGARQSAKD